MHHASDKSANVDENVVVFLEKAQIESNDFFMRCALECDKGANLLILAYSINSPLFFSGTDSLSVIYADFIHRI